MNLKFHSPLDPQISIRNTHKHVYFKLYWNHRAEIWNWPTPFIGWYIPPPPFENLICKRMKTPGSSFNYKFRVVELWLKSSHATVYDATVHDEVMLIIDYFLKLPKLSKSLFSIFPFNKYIIRFALAYHWKLCIVTLSEDSRSLRRQILSMITEINFGTDFHYYGRENKDKSQDLL